MTRYYISKVLIPILLLTILSFGVFFFPVDEFQVRLSFTMSCFLSTFAMLYVVGASLPKGLGVLTNIDWMIMITIFTISAQGVLSCLLYSYEQCGILICIDVVDDATVAPHLHHTAQLWNWISCGLALFLNVLCHLTVLVPALRKRQRDVRTLQSGDGTGGQEHNSLPRLVLRNRNFKETDTELACTHSNALRSDIGG